MGKEKVFMDYKSLLNDKQYDAVSSSSQYVRIIAGAGSGKTRVLTYRISYLISERGVDPSRILAIAFTNKVAGEMKERASKLVNQLLGHLPNLHISTFHAFCAQFLRVEHSYIGYPSGYSIYSDDDQTKLVKSLAPSFGYKKGDDMVKGALSYIRKNKAKGLYPDDIKITPHSYEDEKTYHKFYEAYEIAKTQSYGLDFDDLLLQTINILEDFPMVRDKWSHRFSHILVDEFQDTNDVQYKLLKLLLTPETSVYVVGDPDQTIYTWRGANQSIIMDFDKNFKGAETIILNENYRSTKTILDAANKLIANNKKRVPKDLFTNAAIGDKIEVNESATAESEADYVARQIGRLAKSHTDENNEPNYRNIAVLYRSSYMTRPFEASLKDYGIPYQIYGGLRFYERMEVKDLLAYFNLFVNPKDNVSFERIVNVPRRGIGDSSLDKIKSEAGAAHLSEYEYMCSIEKFPDTEISSRALNALSVLITKMQETSKKLKDNLEAYSGILKDFATDIGYFTYLADDEDPDEDRLKNVNSLFDDITHFLTKNPDSSFAQYLQNVSLLTSQDDMNGGNHVSLMTIHTAKGLEFDYVFVISMNQGAFPSQRAEEESGRDAVEEERRLAYVAFTRAKKKLFLSCNNGYTYVTDSHAEPSVYFKEAGLKLPETTYHNENNWSSYSPYGRKTKVEPSSSSFFSDGDYISPFEPKQEPPEEEAEPKNNGITDWKVGDRLHHEKFGDGVVTSLIAGNIIVVNFDNGDKKTLIGSHPMISKIASKGGQA